MLVTGCGHEGKDFPESKLYNRYAQRPDLNVAQVCGFDLNDSVQVDVVLLQAESDEAWLRMAGDMGIEDTTGVTSWLGDIDKPDQQTTWNGQPVLRVIASPEKRAIGFYSIENEEQYDALLDYQLNKMIINK